MSKKIHFLIGPTAVGKTAASIGWAQQHNAEIVCADAPLIYKGMDIGSAKPTQKEQATIPHHAIDWVEVSQRFSVGDYAIRVKEIVNDIISRGKNILVVGGSGFYLKSFFTPVVDGIEIKPEVAQDVVELYQNRGLEGLLEKLRSISDDLNGLDINNPRRVSKALERCLSSGMTYRQLKDRFDALPAPYANFEKHVTLLNRQKPILRERIALRVEQMLAMGLLDEVRELQAKGLEKNSQALSVIGYREVVDYFREGFSLEELKERVVSDTEELMRKQYIFFKQLPIDNVVLLDAEQKATPEMLFA